MELIGQWLTLSIESVLIVNFSDAFPSFRLANYFGSLRHISER